MTLVFYEHPTELASIGYTSDERQVYRRRLPAFVPALAVAPTPEESGVRLRDSGAPDSDSESVPAAERAENKVA